MTSVPNALLEFLQSRIGIKRDEILASCCECILEDVENALNERLCFSVYEAKELIFQYSDWPPYIHDDASNVDYLVRNGVAEEFLQNIAIVMRGRNKNIVFHPQTNALQLADDT